MFPQPLSTCTREAIESANGHALVYGRCRIWYSGLTDNHAMTWHWSKWAWWKALHYPHVATPDMQSSWGLYGGSGHGFTGPRDAEITHWGPIPPVPEGAPT